MTSCYYYIKAGAVIDGTTRIYSVACGTSTQANRDYLYLTAYAVQHGHYFEIRSQNSTDLISRILDNYKGILTEPAIQRVSSRELVRSLKSETEIPAAQNVLDNQNHVLHYLSLDYRTAKFFRR